MRVGKLAVSELIKITTNFCGLCLGLSIRCLLSQNGLDVEWINPENEVAHAPKSVIIADFLNDYDDDDESSNNE